MTHAITLAEYSHSRLTLFTAVEQPPPAAYWGLAAPGMIGFVERAEARANKIVSRARDRIPNDVPIAAAVTSRPVKPALVRQITDGHHDLVVRRRRQGAVLTDQLRGTVRVSVLADSHVLFSRFIDWSGPAVHIDLPMGGVSELRLQVDVTRDWIWDDVTDWAAPRIQCT